MVKNKVSHSNVKTKAWMLPNIKKRRLFSDALGSYVTLRIATGTVRSIEHVGGWHRHYAHCFTLLAQFGRSVNS